MQALISAYTFKKMYSNIHGGKGTYHKIINKKKIVLGGEIYFFFYHHTLGSRGGQNEKHK